MDRLKLKLGAKVILIHNINTLDCLTNGQLGILIGVIKADNINTDKLVIKFANENAGKITRNKYPESLQNSLVEPSSSEFHSNTQFQKRVGKLLPKQSSFSFP